LLAHRPAIGGRLRAVVRSARLCGGRGGAKLGAVDGHLQLDRGLVLGCGSRGRCRGGVVVVEEPLNDRVSCRTSFPPANRPATTAPSTCPRFSTICGSSAGCRIRRSGPIGTISCDSPTSCE